jgi:hypothetical protein
MLNSKPGTVVTLPRPKLLNPDAGNSDHPAAFQFAVTWESLFASLRPVEVVETVSTAVVVAAPPVVVIPVVEPVPVVEVMPVVEPMPQPREDEAAWEMVVPKMVRR